MLNNPLFPLDWPSSFVAQSQHSSGILIHIDLIASHTCTSTMRISHYTKICWSLWALQWTHCYPRLCCQMMLSLFWGVQSSQAALHQQQPEPRVQGRTEPCFHVVYARLCPYPWHTETHQARRHFSSFLLFNLCDPMQIVTWVLCS